VLSYLGDISSADYGPNLKGVSVDRVLPFVSDLQNMDQNRLSGAISSILTHDHRLRQSAEKRYIGYTSSRSDDVELLSDSDISDCSDCSV